MKISLSSKIMNGPYGGGNTFLINLTNFLVGQKHEVVNNLNDNDIDIILLINPLPGSEHSTFNHLDIIKYLKYKNNNALVVQRFNECDERKGTRGVNRNLMAANKIADFSVFVSEWLFNLFKKYGISDRNSKTILGGSDIKLFNQVGKNPWNKIDKFKIVTHHWSSNWMKGFDTYQKLDLLLDNKEISDKISFTYIGKLPNNFVFKNTKLLAPLDGKNLSNKLKEFDGYITGSINEPSGNHHVEAALSGLPILYMKSGGIPEYCRNYGVEFNLENLEDKIFELIKKYDNYFNNLKKYDFTSEKTNKEYLSLFEELIKNKDNYISSRKNYSFLNYLSLLIIQKYNELLIFLLKIKSVFIKNYN